MNGKKEYGDYQMPLHFAVQLCRLLKEKRSLAPDIIVKPTCGEGSFLKSSMIFNGSKYYGIEITPRYCGKCCSETADDRVEIINAVFFNYDIRQFRQEGLLVIGNPPVKSFENYYPEMDLNKV